MDVFNRRGRPTEAAWVYECGTSGLKDSGKGVLITREN